MIVKLSSLQPTQSRCYMQWRPKQCLHCRLEHCLSPLAVTLLGSRHTRPLSAHVTGRISASAAICPVQICSKRQQQVQLSAAQQCSTRVCRPAGQTGFGPAAADAGTAVALGYGAYFAFSSNVTVQLAVRYLCLPGPLRAFQCSGVWRLFCTSAHVALQLCCMSFAEPFSVNHQR